MQEINLDEALDLIRARDSRYEREAYFFVREALDHTQKHLGHDRRGAVAHVTGQQLLEGIRDFALTQFGPMTMLVLEEWGIRNCRDFGEIVFNMVDIGLLSKTDTDTRVDFDSGYEFYEAFRKPFLPSNRQAKPQPASAADN